MGSEDVSVVALGSSIVVDIEEDEGVAVVVAVAIAVAVVVAVTDDEDEDEDDPDVERGGGGEAGAAEGSDPKGSLSKEEPGGTKLSAVAESGLIKEASDESSPLPLNFFDSGSTVSMVDARVGG